MCRSWEVKIIKQSCKSSVLKYASEGTETVILGLSNSVLQQDENALQLNE